MRREWMRGATQVLHTAVLTESGGPQAAPIARVCELEQPIPGGKPCCRTRRSARPGAGSRAGWDEDDDELGDEDEDREEDGEGDLDDYHDCAELD